MEQRTMQVTPGVGDFRKAMYYALLIRYHRPFQILAIVLGFTVIYALAGAYGLGTPNPVVFCIAGAYLVWALVMAGGVERQIHRSLRQDGNPVGACMRLVATTHSLAWSIPSLKAHGNVQMARLAAVFHISGLFLVYLDGRSTLLVPERDLSQADIDFLDEAFCNRLGERFYRRRNRSGR